jgi:outer membrane protein assembly factor BamE
MLHLASRPRFGATLFVVLAMILGGCASKNPLMEEPTPLASKAAPTANQPVPAQTAPPTAAMASDSPAAAPQDTIAESKQPALPPAAQPAENVAQAANDSTGGVHVEHKKRFLGIFSPYRPDVQQGNFVSREMVAQLKVGMTPDQVVFLLGTPLLNDVFHGQRWDYPFRMQKGNGEITTSHVTVFFENSRVSRVEGGGDLPTEADYLARIANKAKAPKK